MSGGIADVRGAEATSPSARKSSSSVEMFGMNFDWTFYILLRAQLPPVRQLVSPHRRTPTHPILSSIDMRVRQHKHTYTHTHFYTDFRRTPVGAAAGCGGVAPVVAVGVDIAGGAIAWKLAAVACLRRPMRLRDGSTRGNSTCSAAAAGASEPRTTEKKVLCSGLKLIPSGFYETKAGLTLPALSQQYPGRDVAQGLHSCCCAAVHYLGLQETVRVLLSCERTLASPIRLPVIESITPYFT
eukprot:scaffold4994_cov19-Tisochrysis_lutea.AAC.3